MPREKDALNFPYIRVRDVDWLKSTLLIFPHVARMAPTVDVPADDPEVAHFAQTSGKMGKPLLYSPPLDSEHLRREQSLLIENLHRRISTNRIDFQRRFGIIASLEEGIALPEGATIWEKRLLGGGSFQIHRRKLADDLIEFLIDEGLCWRPDMPDGRQYVEMNRRLGEAIMATLATACAEDHGLNLVTEFPRIHGRIIGQPKERIVDVCLEGDSGSGEVIGDMLAQFIVYRRCNVRNLTAEEIAAFTDEREAMYAFRDEMEKLVSTIPEEIRNPRTLGERFDELANKAFANWEARRPRARKFWDKFFSTDALSAPEKLVTKIVEAVANPSMPKIATASGVAVPTGGVMTQLHGLPPGVIAAAGAGFVVALVFRAATKAAELLSEARESPYRYLTTLEDGGVTFSTVARAQQPE